MPYNTRRKSLSLPSLGIHLPSASRRSPSTSKSPHATDDQPHHPSKKVKRSHDSNSQSPEPSLASDAPSTSVKQHLFGGRSTGRRAIFEQTPPASPIHGVAPKVDTEGINDDIVVAVIEQLEKTGNRPHLVKELAAVLVTLNDNVANSANPAALLSSRLSTYMKRPWTALAPCPLSKELIRIHPRKVYYYLTTSARQPLPENSDDAIIPGVEGKHFTPSVSSADLDEEDALARERSRLSPSPEVDLSSPDFETEDIDLDGRADPNSVARHSGEFPDHSHQARLLHSNRAASPPLEGDEKEFTLTASAVRERASEQKAVRLETTKGAFSALTEGLNELDDGSMSISETPIDDSSLSSTSGDRMSDSPDTDYFSQGGFSEQPSLQEQLQLHEMDEAAVVTLFGTSPSPSLTSVASSLSSGTSVASDDGLDSEDRSGAIGSTPQISLPEDPEGASVSTLKRSIDMLNSELPDLDMKMSDLAEQESKLSLGARDIMRADIEMAFDDSWKELQSPETVGVHELDEMFGEI
ncbi:hypothetical protein EYZ11_011723 [Aspergillus tanneri]|uniref:GDS1 winged helix domain-containing protein n=1 Tax=Aspergillus tanneri TaxID=1220188 RepID=A0A4S3J219_9EURO|nr:uncharacterized protein ATNIH1004_007557 [Aspergillus tanneri]KAA8646131.1 hypothetical protein ATNIH1004_007557 [Aspergillus tanneri]THC88829.1 hypothetical protein EYZ11_011723 [Aspergillus tanneri]